MAVTCNACSHGWSETLMPMLSMTHLHHQHFLHQDRSVAANRGFVQRASRCFAFPPHVGTKVSCLDNIHTDNDINSSVYPHGFQIADAAITCARLATLGNVRRMGDIPMSLYSHGFSNQEVATMGLCDDVISYMCRAGRFHSSTHANAVITGADHAVSDSLASNSTSTVSTLKHSALPSIPTTKRVVLVRHGQSTWNAEGRIQGSSDFAVLTSKGEIQAETSRQMLLSDFFDVCFHSPLARAKRTAEIIWGHRTNQMIPIHDLREIDLYGFQGLMKNEGKERYGDAYRTWQVDATNFLIDGHYPVRELWARAQKCWEEILCHEGQSILVVAHNAVNQALVATATGLGPEYFRLLLQSNCGVSVLDFTPVSKGDGPPHVCLDRLNQTPSPPVAGEQGSGRKTACRIILVCHGATESSVEKRFPSSKTEPLNMLGIIQSRKTAELLLDVKVNLVLSSPQPSARKTAEAIVEVQEAADCLGADCVPRLVDERKLPELEDLDWGQWKGQDYEEVVQHDRWQDALQREGIKGGERAAAFWERAGRAWQAVLDNVRLLDATSNEPKNVVVVGHELTHTAMLGHSLGLTPASIGTFHVDTCSLSVIDLPDGPSGRSVVRCLNYTAHLGRWAVPITLPTLADEDF